MEGKDVGTSETDGYISSLLVSFCRTHFICIDLIMTSEIIEAATLSRKQLELVARLRELDIELDGKKLNKKTPQLKHLATQIRALYGSYSEIAHSSTSDAMQLLGHIEDNGVLRTSLHPHFSKDTYTAFSHHVLIALEFYLWAIPYRENKYALNESEKERQLIKIISENYDSVFSGMEKKSVGV